MQIRKATTDCIDSILTIYESAKSYMRANGNNTQWADGYPAREHIAADISAGNCYVCIDNDGEIVAVFAFIIGDDPTYAIIEDGSWLNNLPYGTIHRLASNGKRSGIFKACLDYCMTKIDNIRLDTHADNLTMQQAAERHGFTRCGIIYCRDNTPRIAYQKYATPGHHV